MHQLPLFASSTLWCAPTLLRPYASPLQPTPPSLQRFSYLLQLRHICGNESLLHRGPPICFHPHCLLHFGPPLRLDPLRLHPFKSLRLSPPTPNHSSPRLLFPYGPPVCLDPNCDLMGLNPLPLLNCQPLYLSLSPPRL